jgi:putative transposase
VPRQPRRVIPGVPHHITQRGSRRQPVFFSDADRLYYLKTLAAYCERRAVRCLAWCLMANHIHLILVPEADDDLRAVMGPVHTRYSNHINRAHDWTGHLFEGRFWSYPMDDSHLMVAVRYIENNPVAAGLVARAEDWRWSSARAHVSRQPDGLTDLDALSLHVDKWSAMLSLGLEASDANAAVEQALRRGALGKK